MNIVVCIKQVPDTTEIRLDPVKGTLIRDGVPSIINPDDKGGLEEALKLKDIHGAHITVITMGPPQAEAALREAIAMGVDRAILLTDRKFAGADTLATSHALSAALKELNYDLIIAGRQAIDGDTAQVGPQIAEFLNIPQITYVNQIEYIKENTFNVKRATEEGYMLLQVETPCLMTILAEANSPRYMNVKDIVTAYDKEIEIWGVDKLSTVDPDKLGLNGSPTKVRKSFTKGAKSAGQLYEVDPQEAAKIIVEKLKEKFII
ncbi:electron transfer flavoprotein subunit beta/FixA family protein [uncultured Cetobacterium sp.]|uniref:electron transfer flavoprotein subunit beta/FixA family protein n=1 Tax=uncultured Cetobacterium sp. TaxID=527638 RepID=UPI0026151E94|nr:electron transfer flavoprotein subunit beta/FixA family protein [uncultured Cetobacterium sp.]